jgi:intracellular sulfur oxidation DsrE/DsrF family protein
MSHDSSGTPRRGFLAGVAAGVATLAAGRWSNANAEVAVFAGGAIVGDEWLAKITGKHKQVFDNVSPNGGWGAAFPLNFIDSSKEALNLADKDITSVAVFRHFSMPLMLNDATWAKYKIGAMIDVKDPKTNAPATRNIFRDNVPMRPGLTYEQMVTTRGVIFVACNMALTVMSGMAAAGAKVAPELAKKEWTAGLLPGVHLAASGVYAVNRAQEAGCTYCYAG